MTQMQRIKKRGKSKPERDRMSSPQTIPRRKAETSDEQDSTGSAAASRGSKVWGVSKHAVKGSQKEKRGQKGQDVRSDRGTFEARIGYRPARKQLRQPEGFPVFEENTCCGVPE